MRVLYDFAVEGQYARSLIILLPGALQQPEDFVRFGFVEAVRKRKLALDLALADANLQLIGDATDGSVLERIHEYLVQPARRANYQEIWLGGISIGGFMALAYADEYPGLIDGLCLLAPYPGNRIITGEIMAAGGLDLWNAEAINGTADGNDAERRVWRWLKTQGEHAACVHIHLGYGREDRFASGHQLMAAALTPDCVDSVCGTHDWPVWQQLWENFLDRSAWRFSSSPSLA